MKVSLGLAVVGNSPDRAVEAPQRLEVTVRPSKDVGEQPAGKSDSSPGHGSRVVPDIGPRAGWLSGAFEKVAISG